MNTYLGDTPVITVIIAVLCLRAYQILDEPFDFLKVIGISYNFLSTVIITAMYLRRLFVDLEPTTYFFVNFIVKRERNVVTHTTTHSKPIVGSQISRLHREMSITHEYVPGIYTHVDGQCCITHHARHVTRPQSNQSSRLAVHRTNQAQLVSLIHHISIAHHIECKLESLC